MPSAKVGTVFTSALYGPVKVTAIMGNTVFFTVLYGHLTGRTMAVPKDYFESMSEKKGDGSPKPKRQEEQQSEEKKSPLGGGSKEETPEEGQQSAEEGVSDDEFVGFRPRHMNTMPAEDVEENDGSKREPSPSVIVNADSPKNAISSHETPAEDSHIGKHITIDPSYLKWGEAKAVFSSIFVQRLTGEKHDGRQFNYRLAHAGQPVLVVPIPENPYDKFAIEIFTEDGLSLGFIPRSINQEMAGRIGQGFIYVGNVFAIVPGYDNFSSKIDILVREYRPDNRENTIIEKQPTKSEASSVHACPFVFHQSTQPRWGLDDDSKRGGGGHHNNDDDW